MQIYEVIKFQIATMLIACNITTGVLYLMALGFLLATLVLILSEQSRW